jgi:flagellar biosynthesis chaperone FliJ
MRQLVWSMVLLAGAGVAAELPVTDVILYKNGIGYFVRSGELKAGEAAALRFKAAEMNDVLKSLTVVEQGGGKVTGVRYDSSEPLEKKLAVFPFHLASGQPLSALLDQLRGARVELKTGAETAAGVIVSAREVEGGMQLPREQATLLADSGELRTVDLAGITAVRCADPALQRQLAEYLGHLAAGRVQDKRSVFIDSTGAAARRLRASYVVPSPVWKSSYRLVFTEAAEPLLEGWAIVDNTTGEDWSNVHLALVSGRPVSFISRLYEPLYITRAAVDLPENAAARPEIHAAGVAGRAGAYKMKAAPPPPPPAPVSAESMAMAVDVTSSSVEPETEASERGELFEYRFATPVTVRASQSAMLPFLQQRIAARKLLIYTGDSENPRNAAELTNSTGKTLDGGPITVFDGNAYGGEALMETLKGGDKRLISYAVDLGTRVSSDGESTANMVREIHLRRGVLTTRNSVQETTTYTAHNVDQKPKTLVIEHAIRPQYKLLKGKPVETTKSKYRFEVKLGPGATETLPVAEERVFDQTVALVNATPDYLLTYTQNKNLDAAARKQLERIGQQKTSIAAAAAELKQIEEQVREIGADQSRLRENIASLNRVSGQQDQVQKYAAQLAALETRLAGLRDRQSELRKQKVALEAELNRLIETLEF